MKMRTVLLDRDGVVNKKIENGYVTKIEELEFLHETFDFLKRLYNPNLQIGIITNQQCVAKGLLSNANLEIIHTEIDRYFQEWNLPVPKYWVCPHFAGTCECRKPKPLMLNRAIDFFGADRSTTIMVGDSDSDIQAAEAASIPSIHLDFNCRNDKCAALAHSFKDFSEQLTGFVQ